MSSEIKIPGYISRISNQVYAKLESGNTENEIILAFWRFRESTREDVLDYILQKTVAIDLAYTWLGGLATPMESDVLHDTLYVTSTEALLLHLGQSFREQLRNEKENHDRMKGCVPYPSLKNNISLQVMTGVIKNEDYSKDDSKRDLDWYQEKTENRGGFTISLPRGKLPVFAEMELLIKHMTHHSAILKTHDPIYAPAEVLDLIKRVYRIFSHKTEIEKVVDRSSQALEELATLTLVSFMENYVVTTTESPEDTLKERKEKKKKPTLH